MSTTPQLSGVQLSTAVEKDRSREARLDRREQSLKRASIQFETEVEASKQHCQVLWSGLEWLHCVGDGFSDRLWEEVEWLHCVCDGFRGGDSGRRWSGYIVCVMVSEEETLGGGGVVTLCV